MNLNYADYSNIIYHEYNSCFDLNERKKLKNLIYNLY